MNFKFNLGDEVSFITKHQPKLIFKTFIVVELRWTISQSPIYILRDPDTGSHISAEEPELKLFEGYGASKPD